VNETEWRVHPLHRDYAVSNSGLVMRITRTRGARAWKILSASRNRDGYMVVNVGEGTQYVHVLVLETFVGERPAGFEALHRNDIKNDNRLENLHWGSRAENYADRVRNGGGNHGERHGSARLTEEQVRSIRLLYAKGKGGYTQRALATRFGVSVCCIGDVVRGSRWKYL
jgi:hypothetical protein